MLPQYMRDAQGNVYLVDHERKLVTPLTLVKPEDVKMFVLRNQTA